MFYWTTEIVLAALDAGIMSVQAVYNQQYFNGVLLYGPERGKAHAHAVQATLIQFRTADNYRALVAEDRALDIIVGAIVGVSEPMFAAA